MTTPAKKPAKPGKDVVYIDSDDEITSMIDKVEGTKQKIVALVLPKRFSVLQSVVNMRLLKRSADSASKNVVLITSEEALMPLAGAAGLHVAKNLQSKPEVPPAPAGAKDSASKAEEVGELDEGVDDKRAKLDYHRSVGELAAVHSGDDPDSIPLDDETDGGPAKKSKPSKNKKLQVPNFDRFRLVVLLGAAGLVGLIIFLVLALTVLPKATVTVQTSSTPVSTEFDLTASDSIKALDESKSQIPAFLKKTDQTAASQVKASGQKNLGEKATGTVKLSIPCASVSGSPPKIPAGTGISTSGLTYVTQKATELDNPEFSGGCKFTDTTGVTAQQPGEKYNLATGQTFTVSGQSSSVTASSTTAMTGGTDNNVTILTQQDIDGAKQKISATDSDNFSKEFQQKLEDEGQYVITSTLKLADPQVSSSVPVGQETSTSNVTVKITYSVLTVPKADLEKILVGNLNKQIDRSKQELSKDDLLEGVEITVASQASPSNAVLKISKEAAAIPIINIEQVKKQLGGKKDSQIKTLLGDIPGVKSVETKFSPFWVSKAPKNPGKITIKLTKAPADQPVQESGL